jgi:hypothetical protein
MEISMTTFTLVPGAPPKTLTAAFTDDNDVNHPLASLPVASCANTDVTLAVVGTPTVSDPQFQWSISASATAALADIEVDVTAEGDPEVGKDTINGKILGSIVAAEDTKVALSVA